MTSKQNKTEIANQKKDANFKILHFTRHFSPISQTFIYDTIHLLQKNDIDNHIATIIHQKRKERSSVSVYPLLGNYRERIYSLNFMGKSFWKLFFESPKDFSIKFCKLYLFFIYKYFLRNKLNKICKRIQPDVIHCHFGWSFYDLYKIMGDRCFESPLVISLHGSDVTQMPKTNSEYLGVLLKAGKKKNVFFTVNSKYLKNTCSSIGIPDSKIHLVYNTTNDIFLKTRKVNFSNPPNSIRIINVARLINCKGQKYLIRAFSKFHGEYPQSKLTLVGSGETKSDLELLVNQLDIKASVTFLGDIKHSLIPKLLREHDVYVQPSILDPNTQQIETFGVSILEAIMVGLPVIISNSGGMPEVIGRKYLNKYAFIVPEKDSHAIFEKFKFIISDGYRFQNNQEYVTNRLKVFSKEKHLEKLKNIYNGFKNSKKMLM